MRVTDKDIARAELQKINARIEREAAGLVDPFVQSAGMPIRVVLARYFRHLRRKQVSKRYPKQTVSCVKWIIEQTEMVRLADFTEDRIDQGLGRMTGAGRSPRTVNVYRRCVHSMAEWALKVARVLDRNPVAMINPDISRV